MPLIVEFCGEAYPVPDEAHLMIGREGDIAVDDNPYLHRHFLKVGCEGGFWWLTNVGSQISATVSDADGSVQAWLAPGARLPIVFAHTIVRFTAGPTTYELDLDLDDPAFDVSLTDTSDEVGGETTIGPPTLTRDQKLLLVALAEQVLRDEGRGTSAIPSSADAARRLGWTSTKFNRKLDNVCQKLARRGVGGLHGGPGELASNRRARLVEYSLAARLVVRSDLAMLDEAAGAET